MPGDDQSVPLAVEQLQHLAQVDHLGPQRHHPGHHAVEDHLGTVLNIILFMAKIRCRCCSCWRRSCCRSWCWWWCRRGWCLLTSRLAITEFVLLEVAFPRMMTVIGPTSKQWGLCLRSTGCHRLAQSLFFECK